MMWWESFRDNHAMLWMEVDTIMLSEMCQAVTERYQMISPLSTTSSTEEKRKQNMNRDMHINKLNVRLQVQIRTEDFFKYSYRKTLFNAKTFHFSLTILPPTKPPLTPVSPHCLPPDPSPCSILHLPITFGSVHISVYMFLIPLPPSPPSLSPRNSLLLLAVGF